MGEERGLSSGRRLSQVADEAEADLRQDISLDTHVDRNERGALLVSLPEQLLRAGQRLLLHQVLKGVPSCRIGNHSLQPNTLPSQDSIVRESSHCTLSFPCSTCKWTLAQS